MAIIEIYGEIQQRADTTANWNYVNPILEYKQLGWEYDNNTDRNPVGVKMGDGIRAWDDLPYWFTIDTSVYELLTNKTDVQSSSTTNYPNWKGVTDYLTAFLTAVATFTNKTISGSSNTLTNIPNSALTNSTISGISLGGALNALSIDSTLLFTSGTTYNGSSARTVGVNLATSNVWTGTVTASANNAFGLRVDRASGNKGIGFYLNTVLRWGLFSDGSEIFTLNAYNSSGTLIGSVFTIPNASQILAFTVSPTAPTPTANDNSTKVATTAYVDRVKYLQLTGSGTGAATTISIAHGQSGVSSTSVVHVTPINAASAGISYVTADSVNVNVVYTVAPALGTGNLQYNVTIKP